MDRRNFLAGVGGLVGLGAGQLLSGEVKTCPPVEMKTTTHSRENFLDTNEFGGLNDSLKCFTLVSREAIAKAFARNNSAVPVFLAIGSGSSPEEANQNVMKQIGDRCLSVLVYALENGNLVDKRANLLWHGLEHLSYCNGVFTEGRWVTCGSFDTRFEPAGIYAEIAHKNSKNCV